MTQATNLQVSEVHKIKDGESQTKDGSGTFPWTLYHLKFVGKNERISYFQSGKKPVPFVGMKIALMEYTTKKDGQYTNHTIDSLTVAEDSPQPTQDAPQSTKSENMILGKDNPLLFCMSYCKDVQIKRMEIDPEGFKHAPLKELMDDIVEVAKEMLEKASKPKKTIMEEAIEEKTMNDYGDIPF